MVKNMEKPTYKTHKNIPRIAYLFFLIVILMAIPSVSAFFEFDNIKGDLIIDKDTSEYGIVEIRNSMFGWNWFQLDKIMSLELKENTEVCAAGSCLAKQEIIMYEDGKLIDAIRFIDLETGRETDIKNYNIYVNGDLYNYEEVSGYSEGVKYNVELRGKVYPFQEVDWQIKSAGTDWINEWATWSDSLGNGTVAYYKLDETTGNSAEDSVNNYDLITFPQNWTTGIINNGLSFVPSNTTNMAYNETLLKTNQTDFTVSLWIKLDDPYDDTATDHIGVMLGPEFSVNNRFDLSLEQTSGGLYFGIEGENGGIKEIWGKTNSWTAGTWYHIVTRWSKTDSNVSLFVNNITDNSTAYNFKYQMTAPDHNFSIGISHNLNSFNGTIDEVGIWNRSLTNSEIGQLYNSGVGISYEPPAAPIITTLNTPVDDYNTTNKLITFNCSATIGGGFNLTNISLYHNASGIFTLNQTNSTLEDSNYTSTIFNALFDFGSYEWNCMACGNNSDCSFGTNRTFNVERLVINSETYSASTTEGNVETFIINISTADLYVSTATLNYNNTEYSGTLVRDGFNYLISASLNVDNLVSDANLTFNWTLLMEDDSIVTSSSHNQTVFVLTLDTCGVNNNVTLLNYTLYDEDNLTMLGGVGFSTIIELDISIYTKGTLDEILNFSKTFDKTNPAVVCLNIDLNNSEYRMDTASTYTSRERELEHHYLQNFTLTNNTIYQNISLYNLNSSRSTIFLIIYKDTNFLPIENALINIQREYLGDGLFRSVEIGKTDADGQTIGHFIQNDVVYTLIVSKDGVVLSTFDNIVAWCDDVLAENCEINLNQFDTGIPIEDWESYQNLDYTLSFDKTTKIISLIFVTLDGSSSTITLNTTKSDRWMNDTVCSDKLTSSSGTLTCTIPDSYGNVSIITKVYMDEVLITQAHFKIFPDRDDYFGGTGIIFLLILVIILPLMFITSTIGVVIGSILGIIIAGALVIYTGSWFGVGSALMWLIITGAIIIWKINERSKT